MPPPETGDEVVNLLLVVSHQVRAAVNEALRRGVGLTLPRFKVLALLDSGPSRLRDLADAVAVAPRTMTETVDSLEAEGLLTRRTHPADRRAVLLALTPAGRQALTAGRRYKGEAVAGFTRHLSATDRAHLVGLLESISRSAPADGDSPPTPAEQPQVTVNVAPIGPSAGRLPLPPSSKSTA